eukprot:TRINITY_DN3621_c0_g1_i1.p1 TRINITY_DN3621_c0_g1~~TRINITY_DN3621_c0_g1_i1.p1  ORF type:complete len:437 (-),score=46.54 TRINITY_DN3621_c0_g1_i1:15-1325(-)
MGSVVWMLLCVVLVVCCACCGSVVESAVVTYAGTPDDASLATAWKNGALLNATLAQLRPGDELRFTPPTSTYTLMGGIMAHNLSNNVIVIDTTLKFIPDEKAWPRTTNGRVLECLFFDSISNVTFTSTHNGTIDGSGERWWGFISYIEIGENRPRLLSIANSRDVVIERLLFKDSPYWTVWIYGIDGLIIRYSNVSARRDDYNGHDLWNLGAFNTDGFDVAGKNVHIHDCVIWNQDDCIAVKDNTPFSENMLFERISASGLGLTIGSIGDTKVRNITFRDSVMPNTFKGIYLKFRGNGLIEDVLYQNITILQPEQWAIWIGPAQQADSSDPCAAHPCSLCWPDIPFTECNMPSNATYRNVTLRDVTVYSVRDDVSSSPGVIIGSRNQPMRDIIFDNVVVKGYGEHSSRYYACENVTGGVAKGNTYPVPSCFAKTHQ